MKSDSLIYRSAFIVFFGYMFSRVLGYLYRLVIAREGIELYGLYNLALIIVQFFVPLVLLGFGTGLMYFIGHYQGRKQEQKKDNAVTNALIIVGFFSIFLFLFLFFNTYRIEDFFDKPGLAYFLKYFSWILPISALSGIFISVLRANNRVLSLVIITSIVQSIFELLSVYLLFQMGYKNLGLILSVLLPNILSLLLIAYYSKRDFILKFNNLDRDLLKYSLTFFPSALILTFIPLIDTLMLGYFSSSTDVGLYNSALPTSQIVLVFSAALLTVFLSLISRKKSAGENIKPEHDLVSRGILFLTIPFLFISLFFSQRIITILFGGNYLLAANSFVLLTIAYFIYGLSLPAYNILLLLKKQRLIFIITLLSFIINIIFNLVLIPLSLDLFGIASTGVALSKLLSFLFLGISIIYCAHKFENLSLFHGDNGKIIFASVLSLFVVYVFRKIIGSTSIEMFLIYLLIYFLFYIFILSHINFFTKQDKDFAKGLLSFKSVNI
jgi:O-antigen/teichoic acid export membrane protein